MYEGITFEDFLKVGAGGKTGGPGDVGVPGHHEDLVKWQLSADPRCPTGLFSRKAMETTLTGSLGFVGRGGVAVWPVISGRSEK